jgi:putative redox protein
VSDVRIRTPRGLTLAGTFTNPVDAVDAAVLFSHSFLANRHSGDHFDRLARVYRAAGYATLEFDYSGHGESDDDIITSESQVEDLRAASGWLADQGFDRQLIHGHSFGAVTALLARPPAAATMVLSGAVTGPLNYDWEAIFSPVQLDELEAHGVTTIPDDSPGPRRNFTISKQTLVDLSMISTHDVLDGLGRPVLVIHDADDEQLGLVQMTEENFPRLPAGSHVEVVHGARFGAGENPKALSDLSLAWARTHLPIVR